MITLVYIKVWKDHPGPRALSTTLRLIKGT